MELRKEIEDLIHDRWAQAATVVSGLPTIITLLLNVREQPDIVITSFYILIILSIVSNSVYVRFAQKKVPAIQLLGESATEKLVARYPRLQPYSRKALISSVLLTFVFIFVPPFNEPIKVVIYGNPTPTFTSTPPTQTFTETRVPFVTFTSTPSLMPTLTLTPTFTLTNTSIPSPTNTPPSSPTYIAPTPSPVIVIINTPEPIIMFDQQNWIYFNDPPRVDVAFTAKNFPETYRPMVVVQDPYGNLFGWVHINGAGSGTYRLPGITIGTLPEDCGKTFTIYMIMTEENRVEGQISQLPAGYKTERTVVREC